MKVYGKKILCILFVLSMIISLVGCNTTEPAEETAVATKAPDSNVTAEPTQEDPNAYLNEGTDLPIIKEGYTVPLHITASGSASWGDPDQIWFWEFVRQAMNIDLDLTVKEDIDTYLSLAFASANLPDVLAGLGGKLTPEMQVLYGSREKLLLDIAPHINETEMPILTEFLAKHPQVTTAWTAQDGGIYSVGVVENTTRDACISLRMFINLKWLDEAGLEQPETLEQFIAAMYAFKERGEDIIPMGGSADNFNPGIYILNALGYTTGATKEDPWGVKPAMRNGKPVIPAGDKEVFGEYLKIMNQFYTDGIIDPDFFTLDETSVKAKMSEFKYGVYNYVTYYEQPDNLKDWYACKPLTSDYNDTPQWPTSSKLGTDENGEFQAIAVRTGGTAISALSEYKDVALKFVDWFYKPDSYLLSYVGPNEKDVDEIGYGLTEGWTMDPETLAYSQIGANGGSSYTYEKTHVFGIHPGAGAGNGLYYVHGLQYMAGLKESWDDCKIPALDPETTKYQQITQVNEQKPYLVDMYPQITFFNADQSQKISDYSVLMTDYIKQETAKFITGLRPLSELENYFDELDSMGFQEWQQYYIDYYNATVAGS